MSVSDRISPLAHPDRKGDVARRGFEHDLRGAGGPEAQDLRQLPGPDRRPRTCVNPPQAVMNLREERPTIRSRSLPGADEG